MEQHRTFRIDSVSGALTARKEQRPGGWYWYLYRRNNGALKISYLGRSQDLTPERIEEVIKSHRPSSLQNNAALLLSNSVLSSTSQEKQDAIPDLAPFYASLPVPNNLPTYLTSFIGRTQELTQIKQLMVQARLLTLVGAGGVGKTRLASQIAASLLTTCDDGVWQIDLAPLSAAQLLLPALALAIGIRESSGVPLLATLSRFLQSKNVLLLFDNCEHLIEACADIITTLLKACPRLHILATSREVIRSEGEMIFAVPPLSLPPSDETFSVEQAQQSDAVRLFVERATLMHPHFELTEQNIDAVIRICQQLDGLPLALELAAARLRSLPVEQIATRLEQLWGERFRVLTNEQYQAPSRHQTLRAVIDWSYDLLSKQEQLLLQRVAIFMDGWTLAAAEAICIDEEIAAHDVLNLLSKLINKSLVQMHEEWLPGNSALSESSPSVLARYRLLETVRQYALEKLQEAQEEERLRQRYLTYFLALAEEADTHLRDRQQLFWLHILDQEHANLQSALSYASHLAATEAGLRLASALWWFWCIRGFLSEGQHFLIEPLRRSQENDNHLLATAYYRASVLAWNRGDYQCLSEYAEKSLAFYRAQQDASGIGRCLVNLAEHARLQGDYLRALPLVEEAITLLQTENDVWGLAVAHIPLIMISIIQGNYQEAKKTGEYCLHLFHKMGDRWGIATTLNFLGKLVNIQSDSETAKKYLQESMHLFRAMGNGDGIAIALHAQAKLLVQQRAYEQAKPLLEESRVIQQRSGNIEGVSHTLLEAGHIAMLQKNYPSAVLYFEESLRYMQHCIDQNLAALVRYCLGFALLKLQKYLQAVALLKESLEMFFQIGRRSGIAACLVALASIEPILVKHLSYAHHLASWIGTADTLIKAIATPVFADSLLDDVSLHEEAVAMLHRILGNAAFTRAYNQGSILPLEQVINEVRSTPIDKLLQQEDFPSLPVLSTPRPIDPLTPRESEVLHYVSVGLSNATIARQLHITNGTVRVHLSSIYSKLGVISRTAAVHYARMYSLL